MAEIPCQQWKSGADLRDDVASLVPIEGPTRCCLEGCPFLAVLVAILAAVRSVCASVRDGEDVMSNTVMYLSQRMHEWHQRTEETAKSRICTRRET